MTIWDDRILEIARGEESVTPKMLYESGYFDVSRQTISRRLGKLNDHGLVQHLGNGVYVITEKGEGYLDGKISTIEGEPDEIRDETDDDGDLPGTASPSSPG